MLKYEGIENILLPQHLLALTTSRPSPRAANNLSLKVTALNKCLIAFILDLVPVAVVLANTIVGNKWL
jgi:hypothetical protein